MWENLTLKFILRKILNAFKGTLLLRLELTNIPKTQLLSRFQIFHYKSKLNLHIRNLEKMGFFPNSKLLKFFAYLVDSSDQVKI